MKKAIKILFKVLLSFIAILLLIYLVYLIKWNINSQKYLSQQGPEAPLISLDGITFRDLNKNGVLDIYENSEEHIDDRVNDLISKMNIDEKAGSIFINMIGVEKDGEIMEHPNFSDPFSFLMGMSSEMIVNDKMNHFNIRAAHDIESMQIWYNTIQKMGERSRLGIPITIATDPRHGVPTTFGASIHTPYFSKWPSALGLGAIGDSLIVKEFGDIVRKEYYALGIKVALGPMADIATEPRWGRVNGTFGEDGLLNSILTAAFIRGVQGDSLDKNSVAAMVKHFPGSGALDNGKDSHFPPGTQSYRGGNFDYHLKPFEAAFKANVASVMPYYSIPKGITSQDVAASFNKEIITGLLRNTYKFDGIVCTDWAIITDLTLFGLNFKAASAHGVENLNTNQRIEKIIDAGVDMIGGESLGENLSALIANGKISEERINESLKRILKQKFILGLFDNPYLEIGATKALFNKTSIQKGEDAQKKSLVLLKNDSSILPLKPNTKVFWYGFEETFTNRNNKTSLEQADVIVAKIMTPSGREETSSLMEKLLGGGRLDYSEEELATLIPLLKSKPSIVVANLQRAAILTEVEAVSKAIIADFDVDDRLIQDLIFGKFKPTATLPLQLPRSMESVYGQLEDVPFDLKNALYEYGHGLHYKD